jgi:hypothetical protein
MLSQACGRHYPIYVDRSREVSVIGEFDLVIADNPVFKELQEPLVREADYATICNLPQPRLVNAGAFIGTSAMGHSTIFCVSSGRDPPATYELLRIHPVADDKRYMRVPLADLDYRLVVLSSFIVVIATYATLAVVERMKFAQGTGWFAWLGGGASGIGIGIWSMHYLGLRTLSLPVPMLDGSSVVYSILATIFASGIALLVIEKRDSGRSIKEENQHSMRLEIFIHNREA